MSYVPREGDVVHVTPPGYAADGEPYVAKVIIFEESTDWPLIKRADGSSACVDPSVNKIRPATEDESWDLCAQVVSHVVKEALSACGVDPSRAVFGFVIDDDGRRYHTHVGSYVDQDDQSTLATMLEIISKDILAEAALQARSLVGDEFCPACSSPRYALDQETDGVRVRTFWTCMDCHHQEDHKA